MVIDDFFKEFFKKIIQEISEFQNIEYEIIEELNNA
jgi:hypothetical protein